MALENLISVQFTQEELQRFDNLLTEMEALLKNKVVNLTPEQRQEFSRVGIRTEDWIGKVYNYMNLYPALVLPHIDKEEFKRDFEARQTLLPRLRRLRNLTAGADDTAMAIGSDLYTTAIVFYKGLKIFADTNAPNAQPVYGDLRQQFPGRPTSKKAEPEENKQN